MKKLAKGSDTMGEGSQESKMKYVWTDYYELLHDEISSCQTQVIAALRARRFENTEKFEINGKRASFDEVCEASEMLADKKQMPRHDVRLWKQSIYIIKNDIVHAEKFIEKLQKYLKG